MAHSHDRTLLASLGFADPDKARPEHDLACQYLAQPEVAGRVVEMLTREKRIGQEHCRERDLCRCTTNTPPAIHTEHTHGTRETDSTEFQYARTFTVPTVMAAVLEHPLTKGEGKYRTHIGFLDLFVAYQFREQQTGQRFRHAIQRLMREMVPCRDAACYCRGPNYAPGHLVRTYGGQKFDKLGRAEVLYVEAPCQSAQCFCRVGHTVNAVESLEAAWLPHTQTRTHRGSILIEVKIAPVPIGAVLRQLKLYGEFIESQPTYTVLATPYPLAEDDAATLEGAGMTHLLLGPKFTAYCHDRAHQPPAASREV